MRSGGTAIGRIALGLVVSMAALAAYEADEARAAAVVCQRKGKIRLRDGSCKPKETPVQLDGASVDPATLAEVPSAAGATTAVNAGDADLLDGLDSTAFQSRIRWAHVESGGTSILSQSGGISIVAQPVTGVVVLDFGEDLRGRGVIATVRNGLGFPGWAQVSICGGSNGGGPETAPCNVGGDVTDMPNELAIATVDPDGNAVGRNFYVAVLP